MIYLASLQIKYRFPATVPEYPFTLEFKRLLFVYRFFNLCSIIFSYASLFSSMSSVSLLSTFHLVQLSLILCVKQWSCLSYTFLNYVYRIFSSQFWNTSVEISFIHSTNMLKPPVVNSCFSKSTNIPLSFKTLETLEFLQRNAWLG